MQYKVDQNYHCKSNITLWQLDGIGWVVPIAIVRIGSDFKKKPVFNLKEWFVQSLRCWVQVVQPHAVKASQVTIPKAAITDLLIHAKKML